MNQKKIIAVVDLPKHSRKWPDKIGELAVKRLRQNLGEFDDEQVFLYAIHLRDFETLQSSCRGKFSGDKSKWPQNTLWYTGATKKEDQQNGHMYRYAVNHGINTADPFFRAIERLVKASGAGIKGRDDKSWEALYVDLFQLSAFTILCQGFLAAHGGAGLHEWAKVPPDIQHLAESKIKETESEDWWNIIDFVKLETEFKEKEINLQPGFLNNFRNGQATVHDVKMVYELIKKS